MKKRRLGKTNVFVSEIALGTWQLGNAWGKPFNIDLANETLCASIDTGINCIDTADVYSGGVAEKTIGSFFINKEKPYIITKIGRRSNPHDAKSYTKETLLGYVNDSRANLRQDQLDLVLLHCPPSSVYEDKAVFDALESFKQEGLIRNYGVSIETLEEGFKALEYEGVAAIEVIFNMFRLKPLERFFEEAKKRDVGIIVRVPLASGLLTGKFDNQKKFEEKDHRFYNREGKSFDKGETFSGVDYELGLRAVEELKKVFNTNDLTLFALKYILMFDEVSVVIPGASKPEQVYKNVRASDLKPLSIEEMDEVKRIYDKYIKPSVHHLW